MKRLISRAASALGVTALLTAGLVAGAPASTAATQFSVTLTNAPSCTNTVPTVRVKTYFKDKKGTSIGYDSTQEPDSWVDKYHNAKNGTYSIKLRAVPSGYAERFRIKLEHNPGTSKRRSYASAWMTFKVPAGCKGSKPVPVAPDHPTVTGTLRVGQLLRANPGPWNPMPSKFTYQWQRAHKGNITGATKATYRLTPADKTRGVRVIITANDPALASLRRTSEWTVAVKSGYIVAPKPVIRGVPAVGRALSANLGTWSPEPTKLTYQWYRSGTRISGATKRGYLVTKWDKGKQLTVKVVGSRSGYVTRTVTSDAVRVR